MRARAVQLVCSDGKGEWCVLRSHASSLRALTFTSEQTEPCMAFMSWMDAVVGGQSLGCWLVSRAHAANVVLPTIEWRAL